MLYRKMLITITTTIIICLMFNATILYATNNISENDIMLIMKDEQQTKKVTEAQFSSIEKILEYINKEIKSIDEKVVLARDIDEYKVYPAIRLNIDTPYFGIASIVNSKLKIRDAVSTVDIATGYGIRNIANKKTIKIPTFEVSNIVVITRDVSLNKNMTYADAQTSIFKLLDYLTQVKDVNKFVDKQLKNIVQGYFSKEKIEVIDNIKLEIEEIEENLDFALNELSYIRAITENDITEDLNNLIKYDTDISAIEELIKDIHTSEKKLNEVHTKITTMNGDIKLFRFNVNKKYLEVFNNINLEQAIYLVNSSMNLELNYLQKYIDNSKMDLTEEILDVIIEEPIQEDTINETDMAKVAKEKYIEVYKIASESIFQSMKKDLDKANKVLEEVTHHNLALAEQEAKLAEDPELKLTEKLEKLNSKEIIDELLKIYIGFLNKENVFLTENAKVNITDIKKMQDINITTFEDIQYIYINLSGILINISDNFVSSSVISNKKTSDSLKDVITKVISSSRNFKQQE